MYFKGLFDFVAGLCDMNELLPRNSRYICIVKDFFKLTFIIYYIYTGPRSDHEARSSTYIYSVSRQPFY